jgi:hypothetical protein
MESRIIEITSAAEEHGNLNISPAVRFLASAIVRSSNLNIQARGFHDLAVRLDRLKANVLLHPISFSVIRQYFMSQWLLSHFSQSSEFDTLVFGGTSFL